jgi:protocatechuate 3,4-dioxygenase beta subunit
MAILMDDAFERDIGKEYETPGIDVERGYRFDIVIGGRNATFFEGRS